MDWLQGIHIAEIVVVTSPDKVAETIAKFKQNGFTWIESLPVSFSSGRADEVFVTFKQLNF